MSLYFLHLRNGTSEILDPEGSYAGSMKELRGCVLRCARELMVCDMQRGVLDLRFRIDAEDVAGRIVHSLPFQHAVSIIPAGSND